MNKESLSESKQFSSLASNNNSKIKPSSIDVINQTKESLDAVISQLNTKLHNHFSKKEQQLMEKYKQELLQSQKQLNQLKTHTNQEQIKIKMAERKKELERQRHQLIETNVFFSHKCEEYKKKLSELISEGKELQKQLSFLDTQINNANKRKNEVRLEGQLLTPPKEETTPKLQGKDRTKSQKDKAILPLISDRKQIIIKSQKKLKNSYSVRQAHKKLGKEQLSTDNNQKMSKSKEGIIYKLEKQLEKTVLQELFEATIEQIKNKRKGKRILTNIKGEEFSEYEKKLIMQDFLSKDEVKKQIYSIIFDLDQQPNYFVSSFQNPSAAKNSLFMDHH